MSAASRPEVWVISELYYPEETSTGYFLTGIAEGLAQNVPTGVICSQPTDAARGRLAPRRERRNGVEVVRVLSTRLDHRVLLWRLINALTISVSVFVNVLLRVRRGDKVIVVTNPPTLPVVTRLAARLRRARCILLVHDVYPEALAAAGILRRGGIVYRVADYLSRSLYGGFDRVVVLGRDMRLLVAQKISVPPETLPIITNWGDVAVSAAARNPFRQGLGLAGKFVVQYSGNIGRTHGIGAMLAAASALRDDRSIHFLVIGEGSQRRAVEAIVAAGKLPNITLLPSVAREELGAALSACDVALVTLVAGTKGVSVPSRMYNILAAGKPIIAMAEQGSELATVVDGERVGWVVAPGDVDGLVAAIRRARDERDALPLMGGRARAAVERAYTRGHVVEAWRALIAQLG